MRSSVADHDDDLNFLGEMLSFCSAVRFCDFNAEINIPYSTWEEALQKAQKSRAEVFQRTAVYLAEETVV
jgi:hypothetical protein